MPKAVLSAQRSLCNHFAHRNFSSRYQQIEVYLVEMTQADSAPVALLNAPIFRDTVINDALMNDAVIHNSAANPVVEKSQALECSIQQAGHRGLDRVRVTVLDGWIVLRGRVTSFYLKQLAQEAVRPMAIGMRIRNEVHVDHEANRQP
ncbi:BON domain-containing protein [Rhodopirellula bahusiensis]|uniref:BON domain-containing protein n=1 Tax=Rhodopirellula bahusiensis TaxID=2014065 RepID=UPI003265825E